MTEHFNYGPRMSLDKLHYPRSRPTPLSSEYLDLKVKGKPADRLVSSSTSSLGSHWKKVDSYVKRHDYSSDSASEPSPLATPTPISSISYSTPSSSSSSSAGAPTLHSIGSISSSEEASDKTLTNQSSSSSPSSGTISEPSGPPSALMVDTETHEERQCLALQMWGLVELDEALVRNIGQLDEHLRLMTEKYFEVFKTSLAVWKKNELRVDASKEHHDEIIEEIDEKMEQFFDLVSQKKSTFHKKAKLEEFVQNNEGAFEASLKTLELMKDNERRIRALRMKMHVNDPEHAALTVFEHEDHRVGEVFRKLTTMVRNLPLHENERADLDHFVGSVELNSQFAGVYKCELVLRRLLSLMNSWQDSAQRSKSLSTLHSVDWRSVPEKQSGVPNAFQSSSFGLSSLSDLSTDDSNLSDLDGQLRGAQTRRAIGTPLGECGSWSTDSLLASFNTSGKSSVQSLGEQMTLSSYEPFTSSEGSGESTMTSLSTHSMPFQNVDPLRNQLAEDAAGTSVKTALSQEMTIGDHPPRSGGATPDVSVASGTTLSTSAPSLNFSSVSLSEMVDDALHTAKEAAEIQTGNLFEALQSSASKCGVALSDLMTAISSSSESLSATQPSDSSSIAH
ncbi:unnamed protein product [Caenorhabditis sp. 36 PRJEB53466]|nr:unnamed protein product [Caenorhabditis sp. 36 PRJEB53466]